MFFLSITNPFSDVYLRPPPSIAIYLKAPSVMMKLQRSPPSFQRFFFKTFFDQVYVLLLLFSKLIENLSFLTG